jgi:hypothetical protein
MAKKSKKDCDSSPRPAKTQEKKDCFEFSTEITLVIEGTVPMVDQISLASRCPMTSCQVKVFILRRTLLSILPQLMESHCPALTCDI